MSNLRNSEPKSSEEKHHSLLEDAEAEQIISCSTKQLNSLKTARGLREDLFRWMHLRTDAPRCSNTAAPTLKLDLGGVDWLSSVGLNELISINRKARKLGVKLILTEVGETVREVFALTRLERMFHVVWSDPSDEDLVECR
ncbi:STAS domain-containing protein [Novipirellula sp. SH528]|uniref:STAS domain-containing protein n=1 Tax=Novipirellula sp. SH528 TaxID=3454466 RepID=UPI003FA05EBB